MTSDPGLLLIRFLVACDEEFMGTDGRTYGPFLKEDLANIPARNARQLIEAGRAVEVPVRPASAPSDKFKTAAEVMGEKLAAMQKERLEAKAAAEGVAMPTAEPVVGAAVKEPITAELTEDAKGWQISETTEEATAAGSMEPAPISAAGREGQEATRPSWSLVPLDELNRFTPKEAYTLIEQLEKDLGIPPPKGYEFLLPSDLKAWIREKITTDEVRRRWEALKRKRQERDRAERRKIILTNSRLRENTDRSLITLLDANNPPTVFIRGGALVRVVQDEKGMPSIVPLAPADLRHILERVADFSRIRKDGEESVAPPPLDVVQDLMASRAWPGIPPLEGIIESPVILPDGTVTALPGYCPDLRVIYTPTPGLLVPAIPDRPEPEDLTRAVNLLKEVLRDFPFSDEASRVNAIGALFTAVLRPVIPGHVPLALIDKPQAGTGASLLAEVAAAVATGRPAPMMTAPAEEGEWSKAITALLSQGRTVVVIDNVEGRLFAPSLAAVLTGDTWRGRILGESTMVDLPNRATWIATGNNIQVGGDLPRRCYWVRMDAHNARPWQRTDFLHPDLKAWVLQERGRLLAAILTITRAWILAGKPKPTRAPLVGGFERWREVIGGILENAGLNDFLGNLEQFHERSDTNTTQWDAFLQVLGEIFPDSFTVKMVVDLLETVRDTQQGRLTDLELRLDEVLPEEITTRRGDYRTMLGKAFARKEGQVFPSGVLLMKDAKQTRRAVQWRVKKGDQK